MLNPRKLGRSRGIAAAALIGAIALAGCSGTDDEPQGSGAGDTTSSPSPSASPASDAPFGPACAGVPATGPGSLEAIADDPVATAASQAPALSTLVTAVTKAGLVETLNGAQDITLFAPTNEAFAKIPKGTLDQVLADKQALTNILTYHVVEERRSPDELETGTLPTLQGGTISTAKSGETYTANDASVVCGNVQTGNATVYLIDTVLMPKS
jgi:uncharacterized surface protein with fasciclin (FAS1) repeats